MANKEFCSFIHTVLFKSLHYLKRYFWLYENSSLLELIIYDFLSAPYRNKIIFNKFEALNMIWISNATPKK